jgi:hypothetical protein
MADFSDFSDPKSASLVSASGAHPVAHPIKPGGAAVVPPPGSPIPELSSHPPCRDAPWAYALVLNILIQVVLALALGVPALASAASAEAPASGSNSSPLTMSNLGKIILAALALGICVCALVLFILVRCASTAVTLGLYLAIAGNILFAILSFAMYGPFLGLIFVFLTAITVWFYWSIRSRLPFAAAHLKLASIALQKHSYAVMWAFVTLALSAVWSLVWILAVVGAFSSLYQARADPSKASPVEGLVWVLELLAFFWTANFWSFSLHVVVAGTVGTWWAVPDAKDPTYGAIRRAYTTSMGSVSLGSLLIAAIQTVRVLLQEAERQAIRSRNMAGACILSCVRCLVRLIEEVGRYLSTYALVRVALFGEPFVEAGKKVWTMFQERGWTALLNDVIVDKALSVLLLVGAVLVGFLSAALSLVIVPDAGDERGTVALVAGLLGFLIGLGMVGVVTSVVTSAVKAIFVGFVERPDAFWASNPSLFAELLTAYVAAFPDEMRDTGYAARFGGSAPAGP